MQSSSRFHLLALSRTTAKIFEADQYSIDSLELPLDFPATLELALGSEKLNRKRLLPLLGLLAVGVLCAMATAHGGMRKKLTQKSFSGQLIRLLPATSANPLHYRSCW